jgi:hypothetical protein
LYQNNTIAGAASGFSAMDYAGLLGLADPAYWVAETVKNNAYINISGSGLKKDSDYGHLGTNTHTYNKFYNVGTTYSGLSAGTGESVLGTNPYATNYAAYGNGAYLMVPTALQGQGESGADVGAEVLYEYVDGTLTSTPLWPWPMEDRIYKETGISVTWESKGGLWKTLNGVYK